MQSVSAVFTAEGREKVRSIAQSVNVSWSKYYSTGASFFTIGVSTIGGLDIIAGGDVIESDWSRYSYEDESEYVTGLSYERLLNYPAGGVSAAIADVKLDNTSGRFTPRYAGGMSAIATAILPRRPIVINAGYHYGGIDNLLPQFVGLFSKTPEVNLRDRSVQLQAIDFMDFIGRRKIDRTAMFTGVRSDVLIENYFRDYLGMNTGQYDLDIGRNTIEFAIVESGQDVSNFLNAVAQAENAHIYQDEQGIIRFENRVHWNVSPYNTNQTVLFTADVIDAEVPDVDSIINVVEVTSNPREKAPAATIYDLGEAIALAGSADTDIFVDFEDPVLQVTNRVFTANSLADGSGSDQTANIYLRSSDTFARSEKLTFHNNSSSVVYLTALTITGRAAILANEEPIYVRRQDDSSVTAYEERPVAYSNDYIQSQDYAEEFAEAVLSDFAEPENTIVLKIRARPELQIGDRVSWQGRGWNIFGINVQLDPSVGFVQELHLTGRQSLPVFTIGVSLIGGPDVLG